MSQKRIYYLAAATAIAAILIIVVRYISVGTYRKQIPVVLEAETPTAALKEQLTLAYRNAVRNPTARNIGRLGMAFHSNSLYEKAAVCYRLASEKNRSKWVWNYYLGYLDKEMGDNNGVIENFSEVTRKNPGNWLAWYYLGEGYQASGDYVKAQAVYNRILEADSLISAPGGSTRRDHFPLPAYAGFQLAGIFMNRHQADSAEVMLRKVVSDQPAFGQAYRLLGSIYTLRGEKELSEKYVIRAGDLRIYTPPVDTIADILAHISRSDLFLLKQVDDAEKAGYPDFSLELVLEGLRNLPDNKYVISKAVKILLLRGIDKLALPLTDSHLKYFADDLNELRMLADILMKRSLYDQALKYYQQALKLKPGDIDLQLGAILCMGSQGMKQQAIEAMDLLDKNNKDNQKVLTDGVYAMVLIGEREKGLAYLNRLKQLAPSDPKVLQLWGLAMEQSGDSLKALALYERSYASNPEDFTSARYLGDLLMKMKLWDQSVAHYRKALKYFPNEPYLLEKMATLLVFSPDKKLRNAWEGREYAERAFFHKSSPPMTVISAGRTLSEAYAELGDKDNSRKYLEFTLNLARKENAPRELLESMSRELAASR